MQLLLVPAMGVVKSVESGEHTLLVLLIVGDYWLWVFTLLRGGWC